MNLDLKLDPYILQIYNAHELLLLLLLLLLLSIISTINISINFSMELVFGFSFCG